MKKKKKGGSIFSFIEQTKSFKTITIIIIVLFLSICVLIPLLNMIKRIYEPQMAVKQLQDISSMQYVFISVLLSGWIENTIFGITLLIVVLTLIPYGIRIYNYIKEENKQ